MAACMADSTDDGGCRQLLLNCLWLRCGCLSLSRDSSAIATRLVPMMLRGDEWMVSPVKRLAIEVAW